MKILEIEIKANSKSEILAILTKIKKLIANGSESDYEATDKSNYYFDLRNR